MGGLASAATQMASSEALSRIAAPLVPVAAQTIAAQGQSMSQQGFVDDVNQGNQPDTASADAEPEVRNLLRAPSRGRRSTIRTSLRGLLQESDSVPERKSLLGE